MLCRYFEKRYPALFLTCYDFALRRLSEEASLKEYFPPEAQSLMAPFFAGHAATQVPAPTQLPHVRCSRVVAGNPIVRARLTHQTGSPSKHDPPPLGCTELSSLCLPSEVPPGT